MNSSVIVSSKFHSVFLIMERIVVLPGRHSFKNNITNGFLPTLPLHWSQNVWMKYVFVNTERDVI